MKLDRSADASNKVQVIPPGPVLPGPMRGPSFWRLVAPISRLDAARHKTSMIGGVALMWRPKTVRAADEFGRVRLSHSFFMRDFLYSDISNVHGIPNLPSDPDLAIVAGRRLCEELLEPLQTTHSALSPPQLHPIALRCPEGSADMYFFAWLRWALLSGTRLLQRGFSIFYFGPTRSHTQRDYDRNKDPLGPDGAFAGGSARRPVGRHR